MLQKLLPRKRARLLYGKIDIMFNKLKKWALALKNNIYALYFASRRKDVPLFAKIVTIIVVSYALSPLDLIPDFIPVIGYLDDLLLLPLGIALAIRLIPKEIWEECKKEAQQATIKTVPFSKITIAVIFIIWFAIIVVLYRSMTN